MIRIITVLVIYLVTQVLTAQTKFEQGMEQAFALMNENKIEEASNLLERISSAEPENWLAPYHLALLKVRSSFAITDKAKQEAQIAASSGFIDMADLLSPDNSEVYVVKGLINVAKIASNPMVNGATLSGPTVELYKKAIALDNTNPRAHSGLVEFEMGGARFFGQDLGPYCKRLQESIALYDAFIPAGKFYPKWGKEWTLQVIEGCGGTVETKTENVSIKVTVPNVSGTDGVVLFALYDSKEKFMNRETLASKDGIIENGIATVTFENIAPGTYAIVCLHDKNGNQRMDFTSEGMPGEDYAISNNVFLMGPPNFEDAKFRVENKSLDLTINF